MAHLVYVHEVVQLAVHKRRYLYDGNIRLPRLENENMDRDLDMSFLIIQFKNSTLMHFIFVNVASCLQNYIN